MVVKKLLLFLKRRTNDVSRIAIIVGTVAIITYLFPREGKFSLEYAKGEPWKHEVLIAPYNFPILKSFSDLNSDRDSLLSNFRPYFVFDTIKCIDEVKRLKDDIHAKSLSSKFLTQYRDTFSVIAVSLLQQVYGRGIILLPEDYVNAKADMELMVVRGSFGEPYGLSELLSPKAAYSLLTSKLTDAFGSKFRRDRVALIVQDLDLNTYLIPNVRFDKERTMLEKSNVLKNLSLASGGVMAGQKIIDKGEIITEPILRMLDSYKKEFESRLGISSGADAVLLGQLLIVTLFVLGITFFLYYFRYDIYQKQKSVAFIFLIVTLMILMARLANEFIIIPVYIVPFALLPIFLRLFFDSRVAFFVHVSTIVLASFFADSSFEFIFLQLPIGIAVIVTLFKMSRRSQLLKAQFFIFLTYSLLYIGLSLIQEGHFSELNYSIFGMFAFNVALLTLVYPLIYIFERLFGFLSDVTLVELSDTNLPLLRELSEKAPGTFQHSIQVGNLAQEAAYAIGANDLLVRTGAMYHDIGKIERPALFTENQMSNYNPLSNLELKTAAKMVIEHIESGVRIAKSYKIPQQVIDFIVTHQGTGKTKYFFNTYSNENPDEIVDATVFMYPGPTPFTRETAILMMADSVEAASRSLKNYSPEAIDELVERIIRAQIEDNQFINAPITFKEIAEIKRIFKSKLQNIYHSRIEYPALKA